MIFYHNQGLHRAHCTAFTHNDCHLSIPKRSYNINFVSNFYFGLDAIEAFQTQEFFCNKVSITFQS